MKLILLALILTGCAQFKKDKSETLVFIQGLHLDQHVWSEVKNILKENDHQVQVLERLGRDTLKPASIKEIATLSCKKIPTHSILIPHNFGGAIANAMVGVCPEKIQKIIYLSALVPLKGEKPFDIINKTDRTNYSRVVTVGRFKIIPKEARSYFMGSDATIKPKATLPALYSEWTSLLNEAVDFEEDTFNAIPKVYLYTERDVIISLTTQFQYTSRSGIRESDGIAGGHYPMISNPERLAFLISKWARAEVEQ